MDRKELLMAGEDKPVREVDPKALAKDVEVGTALLGMRETYGWQLLYETYIKPKVDQNRFLTASSDELADTRAAMKALVDMLTFIDNSIEKGTKAYLKLTQK